MPKKTKKEKTIEEGNIASIASDALSDVIYSILTDVISKLQSEDLLKDVNRVIEVVDDVCTTVGVEGIRLRRANVERRTVSRKGKSKATGSRVASVISWSPHPKDKKLEYTKDIEVGKRYILRKKGGNKVVGLLDKIKLDDKRSGYGLKDDDLRVINAADHLILKARGFEIDKAIKDHSKDDTEDEDSDEKDSDEKDEENSDVDSSESEEEEKPVTKSRKDRHR